jgi:hypothetical protein
MVHQLGAGAHRALIQFEPSQRPLRQLPLNRRGGLGLALGRRGEDGAGVPQAPTLGLPANGVGHIARAEAGPRSAEEPGAGQQVEPYRPVE